MRLVRVFQLLIISLVATGEVWTQTPVGVRAANETYERALQEGLDAYERGKYEQAAAAFKRATELAPAESEGFNSLGMALVRLNRINEATEALRKAVRLDPRNCEARFNLARRHRIAGRLVEAAKELAFAVEVRPHYEAAWTDLGDVLVEMKRKDIAKVEGAVTVKPDVALAYFTVAYVSYRMGRPEKAMVHLKEALKLNARFAGARKSARPSQENILMMQPC